MRGRAKARAAVVVPALGRGRPTVAPGRAKGWAAVAVLGALSLGASSPGTPPAGPVALDAPPAPSYPGVPVLLVPGWFDTGRDLAALRIRLVSAGWPADHVATVTFRERTGSNRLHAQEIDSVAQALLSATGSDRLDIVAHSMGGLATRWYLKGPGAAVVRRAVFVASPHRGTYAAYLAWGEGGREMEPESPFLDTLNAAPPVPEGVSALTVRTPVDTHILPGESATLPGVPDELVCCPSHAGLLRSLEAFRIIRRFLDEEA